MVEVVLLINYLGEALAHLGKDEEDDFMLAQYLHRKEKFVKELAQLLGDFNIDLKDLAT